MKIHGADTELPPAIGQCPQCDGCGLVADDDDRMPWVHWLDLPVGSSAAVWLGFVKPMKCPLCNGTGTVPVGHLAIEAEGEEAAEA